MVHFLQVEELLRDQRDARMCNEAAPLTLEVFAIVEEASSVAENIVLLYSAFL